MRLARRNGTFPDKWGARNKTECEALALEEDGGVCILHAVGKKHIMQKYGEFGIMQLRALATKAYDNPVHVRHVTKVMVFYTRLGKIRGIVVLG